MDNKIERYLQILKWYFFSMVLVSLAILIAIGIKKCNCGCDCNLFDSFKDQTKVCGIVGCGLFAIGTLGFLSQGFIQSWSNLAPPDKFNRWLLFGFYILGTFFTTISIIS